MFVLVAILSAYATFHCSDDMDCSLAGTCDASTGVCACQSWTKGEDCAALNLAPIASATALTSAVADAAKENWTNWGGSPVTEVAADGTKSYHLFFAEMGDHCTLGVWGFKSQVAHGVASNPLGPYTRVGLAIHGEAHNPVISQAVDGTWLLWTCGCPHVYTDRNCSHRVLKCAGGKEAAWTTTVYSSKSLNGPWTAHVDVLNSVAKGDSHIGSQNVSPIMNEDGSVHIMFKGPDNNTEASIAYAKHWAGPYSLVAVNIFAPFYKQNMTNEDVWWWRSQPDGYYHALSHRMDPANRRGPLCGGHAFSKDVSTGWRESLTPAYTTSVAAVGGAVAQAKARERPQLMFDSKTGKPSVLFNGVIREDGATFTFAQQLHA